MPKPAVILLSGGLDSATTLAVAQAEGFACHALSFDYGQRHDCELAAARAVAAHARVAQHIVAKIDLRAFGGSALTANIPVPKDQLPTPQKLETGNSKLETNIPITYVPARNTVFLAFALGWAEVLGSFDIFIGVNAVDYSGYPDCRPEFISAFQTLANLATKAGVEGAGSFAIHTPLIHLTKADIIRRGLSLGVDFSLTHSCYDPLPNPLGPRPLACGHCDSCRLRLQGFLDANSQDPIPYAK